MLRALGLEYAASQLDAMSGKAIARNESPVSLLNALMREQLRVLTEARAKADLRRAAIFPLTTLDTYDFNFPKAIDRDLVMKAATLDFMKDKSNVVFIGPSGVGKTHLANALGQLACLRGYRVRFVVAADLVNDLVAGQAKNTLHRRLTLYQVFNKRYQRAATIVTTNLPFKDWGKLFHNSAAASAIADRLVHKGLLVRMSDLTPTTDQLLAAPELAILHAWEASLAAAQRALLAAYPELEQEDLGSDRPLLLGGSGWIADAIITQSFGLCASIARYRREFERARQARLSPSPF